MSYKNIKNHLKEQQISWNSIENYLKKNNKNQAVIKEVELIFNELDKDHSGTLSKSEWNSAAKILKKIDTDKNEKISDEELSNSKYSVFSKTVSAESTNALIESLEQIPQSVEGLEVEHKKDEPTQEPEQEPSKTEPPKQETVETVEEKVQNKSINEEKDITPNTSAKDLTAYPLKGENFNMTAKRLGFVVGTPEYEEFIKANPKAKEHNYFILGEKIKIPASIADKVNKGAKKSNKTPVASPTSNDKVANNRGGIKFRKQ
jgi:hypothetical protein